MTISDAPVRALSPLQASMLVGSLRSKVDPYLRHVTARFEGRLDLGALQYAWEALLARHSILRTAFRWRGLDQPIQQVERVCRLSFRHLDWRAMAPEHRRVQLQRLLADERARSFALDTAPLMRLSVVQERDDGWHLVWTYHHLLLDGWSRRVIAKDISTAYEAARSGRPAAFQPPAQFDAYLTWLARQDRGIAEAFWRDQLDGFRGSLLRGERAASALEEDSASRALGVTAEQTSSLATLARASRVTLNTALCGAWALLLGRLVARSDVTFGICASGRAADIPGIEHMVGLLMNVVPVRAAWSPAETSAVFLRTLQTRIVAVQRYAYLSLTDIQEQSRVPHTHQLLETLVNFQTGGGAQDGSRRRALMSPDAQFFDRNTYPLALQVFQSRTMYLRLEWQRSRIGDETASAMLDGVVPAAEALLSHPERPLAEIPLPSVPVEEVLPFDATGEAEIGPAPLASASDDDELQRQIAAIWMHVLEISRVGARDSFFALGGHSLLANAVATRITCQFGVDVPITLLFDAPTLAQFTAAVRSVVGSNAPVDARSMMK